MKTDVFEDATDIWGSCRNPHMKTGMAKSLGAAEAGRARDVERHQHDAYLFLHREYGLPGNNYGRQLRIRIEGFVSHN